ncbi:MAG: sulfotransferase [Pseudomonadota bacterium]
MPDDSAHASPAAIVDAIDNGRFDQAEQLCADLEARDPAAPDAWVFRARLAQNRNDYIGAAQASAIAYQRAPERLDVKLVDAECRIYAGDVAGALGQLHDAAADDAAQAVDLKRLSTLYTQLGRHQAAYDCAQKVLNTSTDKTSARHLLGSTALNVGHLKDAEALFDAIITAQPDAADVYYNRATLRQHTADDNHIIQIMQALLQLPKHDPREAPLCYALGKEFEDVGDYEKAFAAFAQGANARRRQLRYRVETDQHSIDSIIQTFDRRWTDNSGLGYQTVGPIFILGLPRSGTTLVDRILSAHSHVTSLEEVHDFAYAVIRAGYPAQDKRALMRRSAQCDMARLGEEYWTALKGYGAPGPYLIDKTPANFLYLGLIAKALPQAKIIHMKRHPLASCYAMFKTLFRMGYPFSYDLRDVAHYYVAYDKLMTHWHQRFPGRILDVQYEALVDDLATVSKQIIAHCGLLWEDACLQFYKNTAPTATASAAQVRQPLYRSARDLWRQYESSLAPARQILEERGIACA